MKRLQGEGIGAKKRQAEVITEDEENLLGLLGDYSAQVLYFTMDCTLH